MKTKLLLVIGTVFIIAVVWNAIAFFHEWKYHSTYRGRTMNQWLKILATEPNAGTNALILKQVITGEEPDIITYEMPLSYDLFKKYNLLERDGVIHLFIDNDIYSYQSCDRATNGNFLISWNTTFAPPGFHSIYAEFWLCIMDRSPLVARGPTVSFSSTNVLQFDPFYSEFDSKGAILYAKVAKTNVIYSIELKSSDGVHIKTITGSTTNGEIEEHWNLTDDHGNKVTNDSIDAVFNVTFPDGTSNSVSQTRAEKLR